MDALLGRSDNEQTYMIEEARNVALRRGAWKYIRKTKGKKAKPAELYGLDTDIGEQAKMIDKHASIAREMQELLDRLVDAKSGIRNLTK